MQPEKVEDRLIEYFGEIIRPGQTPGPFKLRRYQEEATRELRRNPRSAAALDVLAAIAREKEEHKDSIEYLSAAHEYEPDTYRAVNCALSHLALGNNGVAKDYISGVYAEDPEWFDDVSTNWPMYVLTVLFVAHNDLVSAKEAYDESLNRLDMNFSDSLYWAMLAASAVDDGPTCAELAGRFLSSIGACEWSENGGIATLWAAGESATALLSEHVLNTLFAYKQLLEEDDGDPDSPPEPTPESQALYRNVMEDFAPYRQAANKSAAESSDG